MRKYFVYLFFLFGAFAFQMRVTAQSYEFELDLRKNGAPIQSSMYGLFFEDINFGADGGLYAELIKNRSFDFPQALMGWKSFGKVDLLNEGGPFDRNPNYVRLNNSGMDISIPVLKMKVLPELALKEERLIVSLSGHGVLEMQNRKSELN